MSTYWVNSLTDSGEGSLREAVTALGSRVVRFSVAGNIELTSDLTIAQGDLTVDGSDNPICIKGRSLVLNASNIILNHIRVRPGPNDSAANNDSVRVTANGQNILFQNCSLSFSQDELFSLYGSRVKLQDCILSYPLAVSGHPDGEHSKALFTTVTGTQIEINRCLFAHSLDRNPLFQLGYCRVYQSVFYNITCSHVHALYGPVFADYISNSFIAGVNTNTWVPLRFVDDGDYRADTRIYWQGNVIEGYDGEFLPQEARNYFVESPLCGTGDLLTASQAYSYVLDHVGAFPRDTLDERVINEVIQRTGSVINDPSEVGGWPDLTA